MVQGLLVINLDPPFIGFSTTPDNPRQATIRESWHDCSLQEIRDVLIDLDAISPNLPWPPRDYILRLPVDLSKSSLQKLNLINPPIANAIFVSNQITCPAGKLQNSPMPVRLQQQQQLL